MSTISRNRLTLAGALWGLSLAILPAALAFDGFALSPFLIAALFLSALGGAGGALVSGRWEDAQEGSAGRKARGEAVLRGVVVGAVQGLVAGVLAALLFWLVMTVTISGFTHQDPVELSVLMSPRIFLGSFFVALSAFAYTVVGGLLLGPLFGPLVELVASKEKERVR